MRKSIILLILGLFITVSMNAQAKTKYLAVASTPDSLMVGVVSKKDTTITMHIMSDGKAFIAMPTKDGRFYRSWINRHRR